MCWPVVKEILFQDISNFSFGGHFELNGLNYLVVGIMNISVKLI